VLALPGPSRPDIVLGGYAVKTGQEPRIRGAKLAAADISALGLN